MTDDLIAVVGMACRLPGARDLEEYWANLASGVESRPSPPAGGPRTGPRTPDADLFDADLFGMTADEARLCDPQTRIFIETCHAALENAGYDPFGIDESAGVFGSAGPADHLATLTSYTLDLHGPSMTVLTACSGSLVAAHLAAQSLRAGDCDLAIAGGSVVGPPLGHGRRTDGLRSTTGMVSGSGAGVVVLRRLADAIAAGDAVRAVIRGSAVNNDGADKASFSAQSVSWQAAVIAEAMALARVHPAEVGYVETNATGRPLGDPAEVGALAEAFAMLADDRPPRPGTVIGSVKCNIGHLATMTGMAGLIKTVLMLEREAIVPTIGMTRSAPRPGLASAPFTIATELRHWPREAGRPRVASVSASGIGGTNVHMVVGDVPDPDPLPAPAPGTPPHVVVLSTRSNRATEELRAGLAGHFATHGDERFADAVATLQHGRTAHPVRLAAVCTDSVDAAKALTDPARQLTGRAGDASTVLLFSGMDTLPPRAAIALYGSVRAFTVAMDECLELFERAGARRLYDTWHADRPATDPAVVEPLLFAMQCALDAMWRDFGVEPHAVLGYGLGEITAATVAGLLDLPAAVEAVCARAMVGYPGGDAREAAARWAAAIAAAPVQPPRVPIYSGTTGRRVTDLETIDPGLLTGRSMRPEPLGQALRAVLDPPGRLLLDVGPGTALGDPVAVDPQAPVVAGSPAGKEGLDGIAHAVAELWVNGVEVDWEAAGHPAPSRRVALPGYPYQRDRYRIDPPDDTGSHGGPQRLQAVDTVTSAGTGTGEPSPFSTVEWMRRPRPETANGGSGNALVLSPDDGEQAERVLLALRLAGYRTTVVRRGAGFAETDAGFVIGGAGDLRRVGLVMEENGERPDAFVHAAGLAAPPAAGSTLLPARVDEMAESHVAFAELATGRRSGPGTPTFHVLTNGAVDISGDDRVDPARAVLLGLARDLLGAASGMRGGVIDIGDRVRRADIAAELRLGHPALLVALRGRNRWLPVGCPLVLPATGSDVLREGGVYVVTGGLDGPGLAVARALGDRLRARGVDLHPLAADLGDRDALRGELAALTARLGPVNGLFHLSHDDEPATISLPEAAAVSVRKALGSANLAEVFADAPPLDLTVLFSGRTGRPTDAAGDAVLDAMAVPPPSFGRPVSISCPVPPDLTPTDTAPTDTAPTDTMAEPELPAAAMTWEMEFSASTHWTLDEHRMGQTPVMPETAWLDLVIRLFGERSADSGAAVELRDVAFHEPFTVQGTRSAHVTLAPSDGGYEFAIRSTAEDGRVPHVTGWIFGHDGSAPVADLAALTTRMTETGRRAHLPEGHPFTVGPRWHNVTATAQAGREKLVAVTLMNAFAADISEHRLHPALLDTATAAMLAAGEGSLAPAAIGRMRVYGDLPAGFHSHLRRGSSTATPTATGDIELIAPDGTVLVSIDGFTVRERATGHGRTGPAATDARPASLTSSRPGLDPVECAQVVVRALAGQAEGAIIVSPDAGRWPAADPGEGTTAHPPAPARPTGRNR
ncbi:type I polyketide synthase [Actinomadura madurae]|uniref:type I polyketide synthase n=1 Tax=Actinomadura madurae TaxID=1993 RepID=UPI000D843D10|nr:type I polyketide synthase [Actinomadura madurae]SPT57296.1 Beta-ketoacyl-acyl-carrier-protein synthase I [Actinomadura madurae]